jgi:hypothetical protein
MSFPTNLDTFPDLVQVGVVTSGPASEGTNKEVIAWTVSLRCSMQGIADNPRMFTQSGQAGVDADFRCVFPADPAAASLRVGGRAKQTHAAGIPLTRPPVFRVVQVQPDGGAGLAWTAYLKYRG